MSIIATIVRNANPAKRKATDPVEHNSIVARGQESSSLASSPYRKRARTVLAKVQLQQQATQIKYVTRKEELERQQERQAALTCASCGEMGHGHQGSVKCKQHVY